MGLAKPEQNNGRIFQNMFPEKNKLNISSFNPRKYVEGIFMRL